MTEGTQILPSLSSWAYKGISDAEFAAVSSVPVVVSGHVDSDFIYGSSVLPYSPVYTSNFHGVQFINKEQSYYAETNEEMGDGRLVYITPEEMTDRSMQVQTNEYREVPADCTPPPSEITPADYHSSQEVSWDRETTFLPLQDALFENSCWQSAFLCREDESTSTSGDYDRTKKLTGQQRIAANRRERRRMNTINQAFETLRTHLPILECERKLSKADTLRVAADYIKFMSHILETTAPKPAEYGGRGDMLLITRKIKQDSGNTADPTGCHEERSISVLLTWSKNVKIDNSVIRNGRKRIRAPIWNPEFPIKEQGNSKRTLRPNSYSLGQLFVADSCEEPSNKMLRLDNLSLIDDRYVFSLGSQSQGNMYIQPHARDTSIEAYGHGDPDGKLSTVRYKSTNYIQPLPEVSSYDERLYQYYDPNTIQSMAIHPQDVPWYSYKNSPNSLDADFSSKNRVSLLERVDHDPYVRQAERFYHPDYNGDQYSQAQVVFPPHQFYQTCKIKGRDITAL